MMCEATLVTESADASSVCKALRPDNVAGDGLRLKCSCEGSLIRTSISCASVSTLLATVDDLIRCQMGSEDVIRNG